MYVGNRKGRTKNAMYGLIHKKKIIQKDIKK